METVLGRTEFTSKLLRTTIGRLSTSGVIAALAASVISVSLSQRNAITLSGSVMDPSGARVPSALVLLTDARGEVTGAGTSGADGSFRIEDLEPSTRYQVEVRWPIGFETLHRELTLTADQNLDFKLGIARIEEAIVVSGNRLAPDPSGPKAERKRVRVGGSVRKARLVHHVPAIYPPGAERDGVEGTVLLEGVIGKEGRLIELSTLNSRFDDRLAEAASQAVTQWRYEPALLNGRPIEVACTVNIAFQLP